MISDLDGGILTILFWRVSYQTRTGGYAGCDYCAVSAFSAGQIEKW